MNIPKILSHDSTWAFVKSSECSTCWVIVEVIWTPRSTTPQQTINMLRACTVDKSSAFARGLTSVNIGPGKLSEAQSTRLILWWKRSCKWSTCQPWSQMFLDFLSGFSILLNHMSSQGVFSKYIYHATVMIYDTKRITWISWKNKTQLSWQLWKKILSSYCTTTRTQCVPTLKTIPYILNSLTLEQRFFWNFVRVNDASEND